MNPIINAATCLKRGELIACPTEGVYGFSCDPGNESALKKLLTLKKRGKQKGFILVASCLQQLTPFLQPISEVAMARIKPTWPGPCTWVLPAKANVSSYLTGHFECLAVRVTDHPLLRAVCEAFGGALVSTSANVAGEKPCVTYQEASDAFAEAVAFVVPGEVGGLSRPTQIYDGVTGAVLRK